MRNPPWSRDELIITLDFYLRHTPSIPSKTSSEISELSDFLNRLQSKIGGDRQEKFRNINGVYMKLMNFRRFDPDYEGKGLERGNKDEEVVWNLYSSNLGELRVVSENIRSLVTSDVPLPPREVISDDEEEGQEGQILTRTHRFRERDTKLVKRKKERVLRDEGTLICEVCGFDFVKVYGDHGKGFIECHHTKPVSELKVGEKTKLSDLSLVCSNCHRMIHRKRPWLSVEGLGQLLK
jgi:5-methylcytosine-specific restriction enzyme A